MWERILGLLFPPKCVLCREVLPEEQTDLCHRCRQSAPFITKEKIKYSFIAGWTGLWYYEDKVRGSLLRFKFYGATAYAKTYGRMLAMKLLQKYPEGFDLITWVPVSGLRRFRRGYDQVELIAKALCAELGCKPTRLLKKVRNNKPQSRIFGESARKANVLNAYRVTAPELVAGKRILVIDDIITTGATVSECAKVLLFSGAEKVYCAAVAVALHNRKQVNNQ